MTASAASVSETAGEIPGMLRAHARTMELSIRLLPRPLREPLGLAYLLARASDTIADAGRIPRERRIAWLERLSNREAFDPAEGCEGFTGGERELLGAVPGLISILGESHDREEIRRLWGEILEGQLFDLGRFAPGSAPLERDELERYCDLVAGSVGRSWTRLIARYAPRTLLAPVAELLTPASEYGKGLQLLNILRDRAADRALGRHYVAEKDVAAHLEQAGEWLAGGDRYLRAVAPGRILMATAMPLDLARATLPLVAAAPVGTRAKLPRPAVRRILVAGVLSLVLPRRVDPV